MPLSIYYIQPVGRPHGFSVHSCLIGGRNCTIIKALCKCLIGEGLSGLRFKAQFAVWLCLGKYTQEGLCPPVFQIAT